MKSTSFVRTIASALLCLCAFASAGFAATNPLLYPRGLAVDAKGNLYVANSGDNNVLVFSPGYALQSADTISEGVSNPTGVALDPLGNVWVANYGGGGSVTEYTAGKQVTANTITNGILGPEAIAIDGLGNIWVENDFINVTVYGSPYGFAAPTTLVRTITPTFPVYGIAVGAGEFSFGGNTAVSFVAETPALISGSLCCAYASNDTGFALAIDAKGNVYMGNLNGTVNIDSPLGYEYGFITLPFAPEGIAVDNARGRVYFSNTNGNSILVYSTAGTLLHTIK